MNPEKQQFLNLKVYPARLTYEEAGWLLGFHAHDIPILLRHKLLKALGNPRANCTRYLSAVEIERLRSDPRWLARASDTIYWHWRQRTEGPEA
ncbi:MAG: hypothetical protein L0Z50_09910 [Verrucomicrobiales bacterium]|nr:hypothetical protein [Verrucomicrobiales bacterium]